MEFLDHLPSLRDADRALTVILEHFGADSGTIHRLEEDGLLHLLAATPGFPPPVLAAIQTIPVGKGMAGLAAARREPVDACNIQTDASGDVRPGARATGMEGAIVVPMLRGGEVVGTLGIANRRPRVFDTGERELLLKVGRRLAGETTA